MNTPKTSMPFETVEIEPQKRAQACLIFLHGLGADGHDFEPIVPVLKLDPALGLRCVFPHAPRRPVAVNAGLVMPSWFDIGESDLRTGESSDEAGIRRAARDVGALIEREIARGIPSTKIVLGGFSQGGALAAFTALRHSLPLGGLIALSTFLIGQSSLDAEATSANRALPAFLAHGTRDPVVAPSLGRVMRDRLTKAGCAVEWHEYPMQHEVCLEEIAAWSAWLARVLR